MPIYEYVCRQCGNELERLQKISDPQLTDCPDCGAAALVRKVSAAAFRLKGGGWYETDFKSGNKKNVLGDKAETKGEGGDKGKAEPAKADKPEAAKTEKPEAKTETKAKPANGDKSAA